MNKILACALGILATLGTTSINSTAFAAGGIYASGGGTKTIGQTFTITVAASGAEFDSLQGKIAVSGPVDIVSFSAGSATWLPGKTPANGTDFVGIVSPTSSFTVATIKLKGKSAGSGSVSISGAKLARSGAVVGTGSSNANFTIEKAPNLPGKVTVASSSHPDPNVAYEATTIVLSWNKSAGVTGFSYLLDQAAATIPTAKVTSADTAITYADKAIGTYYFHIRAQNADGWGATTHFQINIKEPDPKIDESLSKPGQIKISKHSQFINDVTSGTLTGIVISGNIEPGFIANVAIDPMPVLPEGKTLSVQSDSTGSWELILDFPIKSGFYKMTVQGQNEKRLTPASDEIRFEITQVKGGAITILTDEDANEPVAAAPVTTESESLPKTSVWQQHMVSIFASAGTIVLVAALLLARRHRLKKKRLLNSLDLASQANHPPDAQ